MHRWKTTEFRGRELQGEASRRLGCTRRREPGGKGTEGLGSLMKGVFRGLLLLCLFLWGGCDGSSTQEEVGGEAMKQGNSESVVFKRRVLLVVVGGMSGEEMRTYLAPPLLAESTGGAEGDEGDGAHGDGESGDGGDESVPTPDLRYPREIPDEPQEHGPVRGALSRQSDRAPKRERWTRVSAMGLPEPGLMLPTVISMITGRDPAAHGVVGSRFMRRGKVVRGKREPLYVSSLVSETLKAGGRVMAWNFPGVGCQAGRGGGGEAGTGRLFAVCEPPRNRVGAPMPDLLPWPDTGPRKAGWAGLARGVPLEVPRSWRRAEVREPRLWSTGVSVRGGVGARIFLEVPWERSEDAAGLLHPGLTPGEWLHSSLTSPPLPKEEHHRERKVCAGGDFWVKLLESDAGSGRTLHYGTSITQLRVSDSAKCASLRRAGVRWPPSVDFSSYRKGWVDPETLAQVALMETDLMGRFLGWLAGRTQWDLALVHVETPRRLAQVLKASPLREDLRDEEMDRLWGLWNHYMERFASKLGRLLERSRGQGVSVLVVGTGGLVPVKREVRLGSLVREVAPGARVVASEGTAFVYLDPYSRRTGARDKLRHRLEMLRWKGEPVFRRDGGVRKSVDLPEELNRAEVGDLLLEAACGLKLSGRRGKQPFRSSSRMAAECFHPSTPAVLGGVMARGVGGVKSLPVKLTAGCVAYWVRRLLGLPRGSPQGWRGCVG